MQIVLKVGRQIGRQVGRQIGRQVGRQAGRQVGQPKQSFRRVLICCTHDRRNPGFQWRIYWRMRQIDSQVGRQEGRQTGKQGAGRQVGEQIVDNQVFYRQTDRLQLSRYVNRKVIGIYYMQLDTKVYIKVQMQLDWQVYRCRTEIKKYIFVKSIKSINFCAFDNYTG